MSSKSNTSVKHIDQLLLEIRLKGLKGYPLNAEYWLDDKLHLAEYNGYYSGPNDIDCSGNCGVARTIVNAT